MSKIRNRRANEVYIDCRKADGIFNRLPEKAYRYPVQATISRYRNYKDGAPIFPVERKTLQKVASHFAVEESEFWHEDGQKKPEQVPASLPRVDSLLSGQPNATLGTGHESGAETPANAQSVQRTRIRDEICGELNQAPTAVEALSRKDGCPKTPEGVAAALLDQQDCKVLVEWFKDAHDHLTGILRKQPGREDAVKGQAALLTVAERLTPFHYKAAATFPIKDFAAEGQARVWGAEVNLDAVAEIIIAALCDRPTSFKPKKHANEHPSGDLLLPSSPEDGDGDEFRALKDRVWKMLQSAFDPISQADDLREALWEYLDYRFVKPNRSPDRENRAGIIESMIKSMTEKNRAHYFLFRQGESAEARQAIEKIFKDISQAVGGLIFMGLYGNEDVRKKEIDLFGKFLAMLPVLPQQPSGKT